MNRAPFDMLKYFDIDWNDEEELEVVEVAGGDGEWIVVSEPFFPDATLLVVLFKQRGVRQIAVRYEDRITNFDLQKIIVRDGELTGVDR